MPKGHIANFREHFAPCPRAKCPRLLDTGKLISTMQKRRGEITKISNLFEKYKKIIKAPQSSVINEVIDVINDLTGITIDKKFMKYSVVTKTISINAPAVLKQELKLHQAEILSHLKARLGENSAPKIIF